MIDGNSTKQVFISYSRQHDWMIADNIKNFVEGLGYSVWIDEHDIGAGGLWINEIDWAIRSAKVLLLLLTKEAQQSEYVTYEWSFALGANVPVIPIICKQLKTLHPRLNPINNVMYTNRAYASFGEEKLRKQLAELLAENEIPHPPDKYIEEITQSVESETKEYREGTAVILGHILDSRSIPALIQATHDPSIDVRIAAIQSLTKFGPHLVIADALIDIIDDEVRDVRQAVYNGLVLVGAPCVNRLMDIIRKDEPRKYQDGRDVARINAIMALTRLMMANPSQVARKLLTNMLFDTDPSIRVAAANALQRWQSRGAVDALIGCLGDVEVDYEGERVDEAAALALYEIATTQQISKQGNKAWQAFIDWYFTKASSDFRERYKLPSTDVPDISTEE